MWDMPCAPLIAVRLIANAVSCHPVLLLSNLLLLEPVPSAMILNLVERGGNGVQEPENWLEAATTNFQYGQLTC
jgi:hypothetical protein